MKGQENMKILKNNIFFKATFLCFSGMAVFRTIYGGLKMGYSLLQITREITVLHYNKVLVGNLNHSKGTISQIKQVIGRVVRQRVRNKFNEPLPCTGKPRPVMELFEKNDPF